MTDTPPPWDRSTVPATAVALIRRCEGVRLAAYKDSVGVPTIGAGSTHMLSGRGVQMGDRITDVQADEMLAEQCEAWVTAIRGAITAALSVTQASVLISFVHNLGGGALAGSTLTRMANAGRLDLAGRQLNGWAVAGGAPQLGLLRRREYERRIWSGECVEGQAAYNDAWALGLAQLMPLYQRAFADAHAWGWQADGAAVAVHAGTPAGKPAPLVRPVATVCDQQSPSTEDLNAASLAGTLTEGA